MNNNSTTGGISPILSIRIPAELLAKIDNASQQTGLTRSQIVRTCLTKGIALEKIVAAFADQQ